MIDCVSFFPSFRVFEDVFVCYIANRCCRRLRFCCCCRCRRRRRRRCLLLLRLCYCRLHGCYIVCGVCTSPLIPYHISHPLVYIVIIIINTIISYVGSFVRLSVRDIYIYIY